MSREKTHRWPRILLVCIMLTGCATGTAAERVAQYCRPVPPKVSNVFITLSTNGVTYNVPNYGPTFVRNLEEQRCFNAAVEPSELSEAEKLPPGTDPCVVRWCPQGPRGTK